MDVTFWQGVFDSTAPLVRDNGMVVIFIIIALLVLGAMRGSFFLLGLASALAYASFFILGVSR